MPSHTDLEKKALQQEALRRREGEGVKRRQVVREPMARKVRKSLQLSDIDFDHVENLEEIPKCNMCLVFFPSPSAMISHFRERPTHQIGEFRDWA